MILKPEGNIISTHAEQENNTHPFPVRRWSIAISKTGWSPWDERMGLWQGLRRVRHLMQRAPEYGITSVEINGRPGDGWDVDWVVCYEEIPKLTALRNGQDRREHLDLLEETASEAQQQGLELYVWTHELYLPPGFIQVFPEAAGVQYGTCTSSPAVKALLRAKYRELFRGVPSLAGVVLSLNESGRFCLLSDVGCQCEQCRGMSRAERVLSVLNPVLEVCREFGRHLVVRTFQAAALTSLWSHPELEVIREAYSQLPADVTVMSKYCPLDFYGTEFPNEPLIGVFKNPHLVEFSLIREWSGRTFVPVLTPKDFQRRLRHARESGCVGVVARIDFPFPEMQPEEIFEHPNEFNVFAFGRLSLNPDADIEGLWREWGQKRYGLEAAPSVIEALKQTETITQRMFFTKGLPVINYHNMLSSIAFCFENLWTKALTKWDPSKAELTKRLFHPDEEFFRELAAEKEEGRQAAELALQSLQAAEEKIGRVEWVRLRHQLRKLRDAVVLFGHLEQAFFRLLKTLPETGEPEKLEIRNVVSAQEIEHLRLALRIAVEMESKNGYGSWPVISPDRGVTVYEFIEQLLIPTFAAVTGQPAMAATWTGHPQAFYRVPSPTDNEVRLLWRAIVEAARATVGREFGSWEVEVPTGVSLEFTGDSMVVTSSQGKALPLPVGMPIVGPFMGSGRHRVSLLRRPEDIELFAERKG